MTSSYILAHPRVSGENATQVGGRQRLSGSSPRERGKPVGALEVSEPARLIPA